MSILLGDMIDKEVRAGNICIDPYNPSNLGPNSYDLTLAPKLVRYTRYPLVMDADNPYEELVIPPEGLLLEPGEFYLGATNETATSKLYVPLLEGRSSIARLGITVHAAAGVGDLKWGFDLSGAPLYPQWTLEITVAKPVIILPNRRVCQAMFLQACGDIDNPMNMYRGKYHTQRNPQPSMIYKDKETEHRS